MCVVFEQYYLPREVKLLLTFNDFNHPLFQCVSLKYPNTRMYHIFYEQENTIIQSVWANIKIFYI